MTVAAAALPGQDQLHVQSELRDTDIARLREFAAALAQDRGYLGAGFVKLMFSIARTNQCNVNLASCSLRLD